MPMSMVRRVPLSEKVVDRIVAKDIRKSINGNNVLLLKEGSKLTKSDINKLINHGIKHAELWLTDTQYNVIMYNEHCS